MKCPKCRYIGFETGDRCRNCGYDFSLLPDVALSLEPLVPHPPELQLRDTQEGDERAPMDLSLRPPELPPLVDQTPGPALPLFRDDHEAEDEPLVRMAAPRAPIAVRKTPDAQRLRFPRPLGTDLPSEEAVLEFGTESESEPDPIMEMRQSWGIDAPAAIADQAGDAEGQGAEASALGPRLAAALIDFGLLFAIDAVVIHFTLRLTSLTLADWRAIPAAPLLIFLVGLKLTYLSAFTLAGGQTIGKMAMGIRVVGDDGGLDMPQAVGRAVVEVASVVAAGLPFLLALPDPARRGLHDRVAHTRVVAH